MMSVAEAETVFLIHNLKTLQREIPKEPDPQLATMIKLFQHDIPTYIEKLEKLRRLEVSDNGKKAG